LIDLLVLHLKTSKRLLLTYLKKVWWSSIWDR